MHWTFPYADVPGLDVPDANLMGVFATPEAKAPADAVAFLVSDRAKYITGEILDVNGGLVMD